MIEREIDREIDRERESGWEKEQEKRVGRVVGSLFSIEINDYLYKRSVLLTHFCFFHDCTLLFGLFVFVKVPNIVS